MKKKNIEKEIWDRAYKECKEDRNFHITPSPETKEFMDDTKKQFDKLNHALFGDSESGGEEKGLITEIKEMKTTFINARGFFVVIVYIGVITGSLVAIWEFLKRLK